MRPAYAANAAESQRALQHSSNVQGTGPTGNTRADNHLCTAALTHDRELCGERALPNHTSGKETPRGFRKASARQS
jgi:hypothetical protein